MYMWIVAVSLVIPSASNLVKLCSVLLTDIYIYIDLGHDVRHGYIYIYKMNAEHCGRAGANLSSLTVPPTL